MKNKHIKLIVIIYIITLIAGTLFYYIKPKEGIIKKDSKGEYDRAMNFIEDPRVIIENLKNDNSIEKYKIESYNFNKETLEIDSGEKSEQIFLDRKSTNDNKVEVYKLVAPAILWKDKLPNESIGPRIDLVDGKINIKMEKHEFNYVQFPKDATITQFYESEIVSNDIPYGIFNGILIYIKIPKDIKITGNVKYQYINN